MTPLVDAMDLIDGNPLAEGLAQFEPDPGALDRNEAGAGAERESQPQWVTWSETAWEAEGDWAAAALTALLPAG